MANVFKQTVYKEENPVILLPAHPASFAHKFLFQRVSESPGWLVGFVALHTKSTAMVNAGRSVHLTTLFPGQA